jgi:hypothetical protein
MVKDKKTQILLGRVWSEFQNNKGREMKNKSVAIVGLGNSFSEYILAKIRSEKFDEVWAINSMSGVIYHDKCFMMDPPSRFLDTPNAGKQTDKNVNFAEAGRACCEFWLAIAATKGIKLHIANSSSLLDMNVPEDQKLYGYHRLDDPIVSTTTQGNMLITKKSKLDPPEPLDYAPNIIGRDDIPGVTYEEKKNV